MSRMIYALMVALFLVIQNTPAQGSGTWHQVHPLPSAATLSTVVYGNGYFVAGGFDGTFLISENGANWSLVPKFTTAFVWRLVYGNNRFLALTTAGCYSSAEGTNWTLATVPIAATDFLTFANNRFVARSSIVPGLLTSVDGLVWTTNSTGGLIFKSVIYGNGVYVGGTYGDSIYSSTNLIQWTQRTSASLNTADSLVYDGSRFVAAVDGSYLLYSMDGTNWQKNYSSSGVINLIVHGEGQFFAMNNYGFRYWSTNGSNWNEGGATGDIRDCAYGNGQWVAVGNYGTIQTATSPSGPWVERTAATRQRIAALAFGNGVFAAIGSQGDILSSSYGSNWTLRVPGSYNYLSSITFGAGKFIAVGANEIWTSLDGITWTLRSLSPSLRLDYVTYGEGLFVATGSEPDPRTSLPMGAILTSADGQQWVRRTVPPKTSPGPIIFAAGKFVAFSPPGSGTGPMAVISDDGVNWTCHAMPGSADVRAFSYGKGMFVGIGGSSASPISTDGVHWLTINSGVLLGRASAAFGNGTFVIVGDSMAVSQTGFDWTSPQSPFGYPGGSAVAYGAGKFIAAGDHGLIYEYRPDPIPALAISQPPQSQYLPLGKPAFVTASVIGVEPLALQWYKNGFPIAGQTNSLLLFARVENGDSGFYTLSASNAQGSVVSQPAVLTVLQPDPLQNWKQRTWGSIAVDPYTTSLQAVAYGDGKFVAVGSPNLILSSTNGALWKQHVPPVPFHGRDIAFGNGTFVALNTDESACASFLASSNASSWTTSVIIGRDASSCVSNLNAVAFGADKFVAVGQSDILVSSNGLTWTVSLSQTPLYLQSVAYGNGVFVAVGVTLSDGQNILVYSTDGIAWSYGEYAVPYPLIGRVQRVVFGGGKFVVTSDFGSVLVSEDGMWWTPYTAPEWANFGAITFGAGRFVSLVIQTLTVLSSTNGEAWAIQGAAYDGNPWDGPSDIAYGQGTFVAVGPGALLAQSDPLLDTPPEILRQPASATFLSGRGYPGYLDAVVVGSSPFEYEWYKDGFPLCQSSGPSLELSDVTLSDTGDYQLKVSNPFGSVTSAVAHITIEPRQPLLGIIPGFNAQLSIWARSGIPYVVEAVDSFTNYALGWQSVYLFTAAKIPYIWTDLEANAHPQRFYRIREAWANEPLPPPQSMVPAGLGKHSMSVTVQDGSAPFANVGTYQLVANGALAAVAGTYSIFGDGSNIGNGTGTYRYNRIGSNSATLVLKDSNFGTVSSELFFDTPTSGHITTSDTSDGFQVGTFTLR